MVIVVNVIYYISGFDYTCICLDKLMITISDSRPGDNFASSSKIHVEDIFCSGRNPRKF